jgi:hypothetical protein
MVAAPSMEEGNNKTYNLVVHISGLMTQLGSAWQELARAVQDTNQCKCSISWSPWSILFNGESSRNCSLVCEK